METKYIVTAYGIMRQVLKVKTFKSKPTFKQLNTWLNRIALEYGSHPSYTINEVK